MRTAEKLYYNQASLGLAKLVLAHIGCDSIAIIELAQAVVFSISPVSLLSLLKRFGPLMLPRNYCGATKRLSSMQKIRMMPAANRLYLPLLLNLAVHARTYATKKL